MGILNMYINNINFDHSFDEDDPDTIILWPYSLAILRPLAWHIKFEKRKKL